MGFSPEEMRRVTFLTPFEDRASHAIRGSIGYRISADKEYVCNFTVDIDELLESPPDFLIRHYQDSLYQLAKELPKIRQIEVATKRLIGGPNSKNEIWESPTTNIYCSGKILFRDSP